MNSQKSSNLSKKRKFAHISNSCPREEEAGYTTEYMGTRNKLRKINEQNNRNFDRILKGKAKEKGGERTGYMSEGPKQFRHRSKSSSVAPKDAVDSDHIDCADFEEATHPSSRRFFRHHNSNQNNNETSNSQVSRSASAARDQQQGSEVKELVMKHLEELGKNQRAREKDHKFWIARVEAGEVYSEGSGEDKKFYLQSVKFGDRGSIQVVIEQGSLLYYKPTTNKQDGVNKTRDEGIFINKIEIDFISHSQIQILVRYYRCIKKEALQRSKQEGIPHGKQIYEKVVALTQDKSPKSQHSVVIFENAEMETLTCELSQFFKDFRLFVTYQNQQTINATKANRDLLGSEYILSMYMSIGFVLGTTDQLYHYQFGLHSFVPVQGPLESSTPSSQALRKSGGYKTDGEGPARNTRQKLKQCHGSDLAVSDFDLQSQKVGMKSVEGDITPKRVTSRSRRSRVIEDDSEEEPEEKKTTRKRVRRSRYKEEEEEEEEEEGNSDKENERSMEEINKSIGRMRYKSTAQNEYDKAIEKLQLSDIPDVLPCRDKEVKQIQDYIQNGLQNKGSSSSLYISGMPGTGKTATTLETIAHLMKDRKNKFNFIKINAMSLTNPNLVYTIIAEHLTGKRQSPSAAAQFLDDYFKKKDKVSLLLQQLSKADRSSKKMRTKAEKVASSMLIVLVDELDALVTKKQTLLYNLFDWPCNQNSKLLVIAIANTMDLPERFQVKIVSRIGNNRLVYEPYNLDQIKQILVSRIQDIPIFEANSVELVARKVSTYSGDIRRSLQIMKRAVELCKLQFEEEQRHAKAEGRSIPIIQVAVKHVLSAFDELYSSKTAVILRSLRRYEVLTVLALYLELHQNKGDRVLMEKVQDRCDNMLKRLCWDMDNMPSNVFREIVKRLNAIGIINMLVEPQKIIENAYLKLSVFPDEIFASYKEHEIYQKFEMELAQIQNQSAQ